MRIQTMTISGLTADPRNPRTHDEINVKAIADSLSAHGQVEPILVQESSGMVIAGNGRVQAMKTLGWAECKTILLDVSDDEARALSIRLNRTAELAGWDSDVLAAHLAELTTLSDYDATEFGFSDEELGAMLDDLAEYTPAPEVEHTDEDIDETTDDDATDALPPNTKPTDMKSQKAQEVRLYLSPEQHQIFQIRIRRLAQTYETDNITDTLFEAVERADRCVCEQP